MACFSPLVAFQTDGGDIVFAERGKIRRELKLPCGQCIGCRKERSRQWAVRVMHETQMHDCSLFVTLTYDDDHLPDDMSLRYSDFQKFMKRLRKAVGPVRFFACGEYGERYARPHYHACLFGCWFHDRYYWRKSSAGFDLFRSPMLEKLWGLGSCEIGDVSFDSAAYVSGYIYKKINGNAAERHYQCVDSDTGEIFWRVPEFGRMSLKPGIGFDWFDKFKREVYPLDRVVLGGVEQKPPKYYDKLLALEAGTMSDDIAYERYLRSLKLTADSTPDRLRTREVVAHAKLKTKIRSLE